MPEDSVDFSTVTYDTVVENCLSDDVRATIPDSWGKKFKGKSMGDVFQSHVSTEQEISRRVRVPDDDTSDEDRRKFHTKCGCPETADGYEFELPENHDPDFVKWAKGTFHKIGVSKRKAALLLKDYNTYSSERVTQAAAAAETAKTEEAAKAQASKVRVLEKAEETLRDKWKGEGEYDTNVDMARKGFEGIFSDGCRAKLAKAGLNNDPELVEAMYEHASKLAPDHFVKGKSGGKGESTEQMLNRMYPPDAENPNKK